MKELDTLIQNVLTLNKMIVMRKKPQGSSKRVKLETKRITMRKTNIYTMEDSEEEDTSGDEKTQILFMGVDTQAHNGESDEEGEVDLKSELISAIEELEKCRRKNKQSNHVIGKLETQLLESKRIAEDLNL